MLVRDYTRTPTSGLIQKGQICQKICGSKDNQWNVLQDIDDWLQEEFYDDENDLTLYGMPYKGKWKWLKDNDYQLQKNNMLPSYLKDANDELERFRKEREIRSPTKRTRPEDEPSPASPATKVSKKDTTGSRYMDVNEFSRRYNNGNNIR
ncbi:unnamed protein product [Cylindrotheca closterium]|uniref:Uncharacterized protein n=1 Tax=Cylindrotheca closterium TaxID=2856 RepID=A0AAD2FH02_9STRA|nr:unnamed protein product [Cylindrotheca closterium]